MGERSTAHVPKARLGRWGIALGRHWPALLLLAVALPLLRPFFSEPPLSHDHPVHLFKAWNFWTEMLARGRLRGWTPYYGFGYPAGELTPFGPEAWVALFRAATFGLLSWLRTYGIAFAGTLLFASFGMLSFTRRQFGAGAAVVAAILSLIDPGDWAEGGWQWHTTFGVWPVTLAMGFVLFALAKLTDVLSRERWRDALYAGLLIAASLVVHQLSITVYPVVVPLLLLDRRLRDGRLSGSQVLRVLAACALGVGLTAFYLLPMLARSNLTQDLGVLGDSLQIVGKKVADASLFGGMWSPLFALGFCGACLAIADLKQFRPFVPLTALSFVLLSSNLLIQVLHLERLVAGVIKLEAHRFLLVAKLFWFPLIGHAIATLYRLSVPSGLADRLARRRRRVALVLLALLAAPLVMPIARRLYRTQVDKFVQTPQETQYWADLSKLLEWTRSERHSSNDFYRIAYALPMHDHLSGIAPAFDQTLFYKVGYTPAQQFNRFPMTDEPELLEALSVKYFVTDQQVSDANFAFERSFGALTVYRFRRYRAEPFDLVGRGQARLLAFEPERIRIAVSGSNAASRLRLHVASYPRWRASLAGKELPITTVTVHDTEYPMLMEVPVHDGELEFYYARRGIDWLGFALTGTTLVLLAGSLIGAVFEPRSQALRRLALRRAAMRAAAARAFAGIHARLGRGGWWALAAAGCAALIGVGWSAVKLPLPADSIFRHGNGLTLELGGTLCRRVGSASFRCGDDRVEASVNSGIYGAHFCMNAPDRGPLVVTIAEPTPSFVAGRYDTVPGPGRITLEIGEHRVGSMPTRGIDQGLQFFQFDTRGEAASRAPLRVTISGAPLHCFDLSLVARAEL